MASEPIPIHTPVVTINISRLTTWAIVDSMADISIMSEQFFKKLPSSSTITLHPSRINQLTGVSGDKLSTLGAANIDFQIDTIKVAGTFEIVSGIRKDVLLGSDFLSKVQATLDYESCTLQIGSYVILLKKKSDLNRPCFLVETTQKVSILPQTEHLV